MTALNEGVIALGRGDRDRARGLLARCRSLLADAGIAASSDDQHEIDRLRDRVG